MCRPTTESLEPRQLLAGDLVGHWLADQQVAVGEAGEPTVWADLVSGAPATAEGAPQLVADAFGGRAVMAFDATDGIDGFRVRSAENPLRAADDFSVAVVFATDSTNLVGTDGSWFENTGLVDSSALGFSADWGVSLNAAGQLSAGMGAGFGATPKTAYTSLAAGLNDGQLHRVVVTRVADTISLFVDDQLAATETGFNTATRAPLDVGFGMLSNATQGFEGQISQVRLYDGALSGDEVTSLGAELETYYNNGAPITVDDSYSLNEDETFFFINATDGLLGNDSDPDGDTLTPVVISGPNNGTLNLNADGSFIYSPDRDFNGTDTVVYAASDFRPGNEATVTFDVAPVYDPPRPINDSYQTTPDGTIQIPGLVGILSNDINVDGAALTAVLDQDVTNGILTLTPDGGINYQPNGFAGEATFTYRIDDGTGLSESGTVTFVVNTPPAPADDNYVSLEDELLVVSAADGVLANDVDADGNPLTLTLDTTTTVGTLELQADGSFTYTPEENYVGADSFTYIVSDSVDTSSTVTVNLDIQAVNDLPTAESDAYAVTSSQLFVNATAGVLANDADIDGPNDLVAQLVDGTTNGTLELSESGAITYVPQPGFTGRDQFTYRASDGEANTETVEVALFVQPTSSSIAQPTGDSIVTFSELMYNPDGSQAQLEWVELRNQMGINMDISGWALTGGIFYEFPDGTVIPGNSNLVIASNPAALAEQTGFADAMGPFDGRLSNGGEDIILRNNSERLMDFVDYNDRGDWPVGPDGSGATLAKRGVHLSSEEPANWSTSWQIGGTPGADNFPEVDFTPVPKTLVGWNADAKFVDAGAALPADWTSVDFDDSAWSAGNAVLANIETPFPADTLGGLIDPGGGLFSYWPLDEAEVAENLVPGGTEGTLVSGPRWNSDAIRGSVLTFDGRNDHVLAGELPAIGIDDDFTWSLWFNQDDAQSPNGVIIGNRSGGQADPLQFVKLTPTNFEYYNGGGDPILPFAIRNEEWIHLAVVKDGPALTYYANGEVVAAGETSTDLAPGPFFIGGDPAAAEYADGKIDDVALWSRALPAETITGLAAGEFTPAEAPTTFRPGLLLPEDFDPNQSTSLGTEASTYYVRHEFEFVDVPAQTELVLETVLEDGAVYYLNGQEIHRQNMPAGPVTSDTLASSEIAEIATPTAIPIPIDAIVRGTNVLAIELHPSSQAADDVILASKLTAFVTPIDPASILMPMLNEINPAGESIQVELYNPHDAAIDLTGYKLADYTFESGTLAAGGYLTLDSTQLGINIDAGDTLFLVTPFNQNVADAQEVSEQLIGRDPSKDNRWFFPAEPTFGAPNRFVVNQDIVFNELMYHSRGTYVAELDKVFGNGEEWIELHNTSTIETIDLSGWELDDGVEFVFPQNTVMAPESFLVISNDPAKLLANRPDLSAENVLGPFDRSLSNGGENLQLVDAKGNLVDELHYYDGGAWDGGADAGGSSLELRDPLSDNAAGAAWSASDELHQTAWETITVRGVVERNGNDPTTFHELLLGMLDDGVVMIDDVVVTENPGTDDARSLIQNGTFDNDAIGGPADKWRIIGTQHGTVIADPDDAANQVLLLEATGPTEHMHNNAGTTLKAGDEFVRITNGTEYEVSLRARYVSGSNQLNSRLYFNRLGTTTRLQTPEHVGTPGKVNSQRVANIGPTYADMIHSPAVPAVGQPVTVSVRANDPQGIASLTINYSVAGEPFATAPMTLADDGLYHGTIPGQAEATLVHFYVEGLDVDGVSSMEPAAGPESRALYRVQDGEATDDARHNLRILMTDADAEHLHEITNVMSNDRTGATVIYREGEIYYDVGVRLKGSQRGRFQNVRVGFNIGFSSDQLFRDVHSTIGVDRSGSGDEYSQEEIIVRQIINRAGGGDGAQIYDDLINVIAPDSRHTGSAMLNLARYNDVFLDSQYIDGSAGTAFEYELIYFATTTSDRSDPESLKVPSPDSVAGVSMSDQGDDKESYRWHWQIENNREEDDYSRIMEILPVLGERASNEGFYDRLVESVDVDQWLRSFAVVTLTGIGDNYAGGSQHNGVFYVRPSDSRMLFLPWDMDFSFTDGATSGLVRNNELRKFIEFPEFERAYYGHILDVLNTAVNSEYVDPWIDYYSTLVPTNAQRPAFQTHKNWIRQRNERANEQILSAIPAAPFELTSPLVVDAGAAASVTMNGTAWVDVREIRLAGSNVALPLTWVSTSEWQADVPVMPGTNDVVIEAYGFQGDLLATQTVNVTTTGQSLLGESLRIMELSFNPADPADGESNVDNDAFEFIELQNIGTEPIDLSGVQLIQVEIDRELEGVRFAFDPQMLAPGELIVVPANRDAFRSRYGASDIRLADGIGDAGQFGVYSGSLANGGETLTLIEGNGRIIQQFAFDDGWYDGTDGDGLSIEVLSAALPVSEWNNSSAWQASVQIGGTPGSAPRSVGDANDDGMFSTEDLLLAFQSGKYESGVAGDATFAEGDWNGDGVFTTADLVLAFVVGGYVPTVELNPALPAALEVDAIDALFGE